MKETIDTFVISTWSNAIQELQYNQDAIMTDLASFQNTNVLVKFTVKAN